MNGNTCHILTMTDKPAPKRPRDANQLAKSIVDIATGEAEDVDMPPKLEAQRLGGIKGGKARAEKLTPDERSRIAAKAASSRWSKPRP